MPVVLFAQLMPLPPQSTSRQFEARIKWCRGIYEAATTAIEIVRVKSVTSASGKTESKSLFVIDKDRFGMADTCIECSFDKGRYVFVNPIELADKIEAEGEKPVAPTDGPFQQVMEKANDVKH
jgi:hypothetical protein